MGTPTPRTRQAPRPPSITQKQPSGSRMTSALMRRPRGSRGPPSRRRRTHRSRRHRASRATSPLYLRRADADVEGDGPVVVGDDEESADERADDEADAGAEADGGPAAG